MRDPGDMAITKDPFRKPMERRLPMGAAPCDLNDYAQTPTPRLGRPPRHDLSTWAVTEAEVDVFEA